MYLLNPSRLNLNRRWNCYVKIKERIYFSSISEVLLQRLTGLTLSRATFPSLLRSLAEKRPEWIVSAVEIATNHFQLRESDYTVAISSCGKARLWQHACGLWEEMPRRKVQSSVISYSAAISACEKSGKWEHALQLFEGLVRSRVNGDAISYNACISACEKGGQWQKSLFLFADMRRVDVKQDVYSFSATISACEKGGQWQLALSLFQNMFSVKVIPGVISYSAAISACEKSGQWQHALRLFQDMPNAEVSPNVISYSATIGACEKGGQWQEALRLFEAMPRVKIRPNAISFSAAISACKRSNNGWQQALHLFSTMPQAKVEPNIINYNAVLSACERGDAWQQALSLLETMPHSRIEPDTVTYNSILDCRSISTKMLGQIFQEALPALLSRLPPIQAQHLDLHGLSEGSARLMLHWWLSTVVVRRLRCESALSCVIVTGYGKSRQCWHESDLQAATMDTLQSLKLNAAVLPENRGRIRVNLTEQDLQKLGSAGMGCCPETANEKRRDEAKQFGMICAFSLGPYPKPQGRSFIVINHISGT